jgi:hypothetical protein
MPYKSWDKVYDGLTQDIWSLGVTVKLTVMGSHPSDAGSTVEPPEVAPVWKVQDSLLPFRGDGKCHKTP